MQIRQATPLPSDPFAPVVQAEADTVQRMQEGLTLQQLEHMLSDIQHQPTWRQASDKACDYYDGHQLSYDRLERMERLGIPPLVTNLIRPTIDTVLGMEARTRTDWRIIEEDDMAPVPEIVLKALNQKLTEAERETRADRAISDAYASQIKSGIGWVEVSRSVDAMAYPYRVRMVPRGEIWWDWRSKQPDLSDARYLVRKQRFDVDELTAMMPEYAELIETAVSLSFKTWQWDMRDQFTPDLAYAAEVERVTNIDDAEWRDAERKRATLFEVWYRVWRKGPLLKLPNGMTVPYDEADPRQAAAVLAGLIQPRHGVYSEVRVAFYLGPHRLYDLPSPYKHRWFPYVPFWGFREDKNGIPYGLVRSMISPQDVVNSADARMHWMLTARRLVAHSNAIDTRANSWRQVQDELARPDAVVLLDPNNPNAVFKVEQDFQLTTQQYQRRVQAASDIENAGGVFKAMMGKESASSSGIAINALVEQGSVTLAELNDNYRFARRQVGEMLFSMVREDLAGTPTPVAVQPKGARQKEIVVLNQRAPDGRVVNSTLSPAIKVVLADVPSTPAFRAQQLQVLSEVVKSLPEGMQMATVDFLVKLTDVPDKEMLVERLRKMANIQDLPPELEAQQMAAQQQIQAEALRLQGEAAQANIEETRAKARKVAAEAAKIAAETQLAQAEIDMARQGGGQAAAALQAQLQQVVQQAADAQAQAQAQLQQAQFDAEQRIQEMQIQLTVQKAGLGVKQYEVDQNTALERERIQAEHAARLAEIEASRQTAQSNTQDAFGQQAQAISKQIDDIRNELKALAQANDKPLAPPAPAEPPVINVTVPVTVERGSGNKVAKLIPTKDGGYTVDMKDTGETK